MNGSEINLNDIKQALKIYHETQTKKKTTKACKTPQHTGNVSAISDVVAELHFKPAAGSWICNGLTRTAEPSVARTTPLEQHVSQVPVRQCQ